METIAAANLNLRRKFNLRSFVTSTGITRLALTATSLAVVLLVISGLSVMVMMQTSKDLLRLKQQQLDLGNLALELSQSSDDLTRMARTYVVTRDETYRQRYHQILRIRNGEEPRPLEYTEAFWDLVLPNEEYSGPVGKAVPLDTLISDEDMDPAEENALKMSQQLSDDLAELEDEAMRVVSQINYRDAVTDLAMHP